MTERTRRFSLAAAMLAAAILAACTNSDPLAPQPGNVDVALRVSPPGAAGFDNFTLSFVQVGIKPLDPGASSAFGTSYIGTLTEPLPGVNFSQFSERTLGTVTLPVGRYKVDQVSLDFAAGPMFVEFSPVEPVDPCNPSNCLQYVVFRNSFLSDPADPESERFNGRLPAPELLLSGFSAYRLTNLTASPEFDVFDGQAARVTVVIDGAQLAQKMLAAYSCVCASTCGNTPAPCLFNFVRPSDAEIASLVSVE